MSDREQREGREGRREDPKDYGKRSNNTIAGLILLAIGGVLLSRQVGVYFPHWLFTWPMIPIIFGLFLGARNNFRDFSWLIFTAVGFYFLADDIWPDFEFSNFILPTVVILVGLILLLRPRKRKRLLCWDKHEEYRQPGEVPQTQSIPYTPGSVEDYIDVTSIFGGVKKNVLSKSFKGGDIVSVFGGSEINLTQADFDQKVIIDAVQIFGGTKLIIPSHWQVRSEVVAIFGGIEDKRAQLTNSSPERILILKGFTMFGGLEIKSY